MKEYLLGIPISISAPFVPAHSIVAATHKSLETIEASDYWLKFIQPIQIDPIPDLLDQINSIANLKDNWDGLNATVPDYSVVHNSLAFLRVLPKPVITEVKGEDITATPYGTIVFDFYNAQNKVSVEIGERKIGFYSEFADGDLLSSEGVLFNQNALPNSLVSSFNKLYKEKV